MTFTSTPPTKPGFYAWKSIGFDHVQCGFYSMDDIRFILAQHEEREWCLLVPAEEMEKAFREGWRIGIKAPFRDVDTCWLTSNARKVVEGEK